MFTKTDIEKQKLIIENTVLPEDKKKSAIEVLDFIISLSEKELDFVLNNEKCSKVISLFTIEKGNSDEVLPKLRELLRGIKK